MPASRFLLSSSDTAKTKICFMSLMTTRKPSKAFWAPCCPQDQHPGPQLSTDTCGSSQPALLPGASASLPALRSGKYPRPPPLANTLQSPALPPAAGLSLSILRGWHYDFLLGVYLTDARLTLAV